MSDKKKWPLEQAKAVAVELLSYLHGFCERAQIAGSIRRGKSLVGDIEILYIPKMEMRKTDMFSAHEVDLAEIKEGNTLLETFAKRVSDAITVNKINRSLPLFQMVNVS
jgi:DNA polymerase/3'-5' exonuclease PolX